MKLALALEEKRKYLWLQCIQTLQQNWARKSGFILNTEGNMPLPFSQTLCKLWNIILLFSNIKKHFYKKTKTCKNDFELPEDES